MPKKSKHPSTYEIDASILTSFNAFYFSFSLSVSMRTYETNKIYQLSLFTCLRAYSILSEILITR